MMVGDRGMSTDAHQGPQAGRDRLDDALSVTRDHAAIAAEAVLDGLYVLRTSVPAEAINTADTVRAYKSLARVERAFRSLKTRSRRSSDPSSGRPRVRAPRVLLHARLSSRKIKKPVPVVLAKGSTSLSLGLEMLKRDLECGLIESPDRSSPN